MKNPARLPPILMYSPGGFRKLDLRKRGISRLLFTVIGKLIVFSSYLAVEVIVGPPVIVTVAPPVSVTVAPPVTAAFQ